MNESFSKVTGPGRGWPVTNKLLLLSRNDNGVINKNCHSFQGKLIIFKTVS